MKKKSFLLWMSGLSILFSIGCTTANGRDAVTLEQEYLVIDDFSSELSLFNTSWVGFTDRVMGGRSDIEVVRLQEESTDFVRMSGEVSLENNGGFIQIRLETKGSPLPAGASGLRLQVRGIDQSYYIFVRTRASWFPWQYYSAPIPVSEEWQTVDIPWTSFKKGDFGTFGELNIHTITSMAIVAYGQEFTARLDIAEIGLYR